MAELDEIIPELEFQHRIARDKLGSIEGTIASIEAITEKRLGYSKEISKLDSHLNSAYAEQNIFIEASALCWQALAPFRSLPVDVFREISSPA